jgi:PAS domain S-box-containing protein
VKDPEKEMEKISYIRSHPKETVRSILELRDGTVLDTYSGPVSTEDGSYYGRLWTFRDVTESRRAALALQESEERFRRVFEETPIGMAMSNRNRTFVRANSAFCEMLGYTEEEIKPLTPADVLHPDDLHENLAEIDDLIEGKTSRCRSERRFIRKNGSIVWVSLTMTAMRGTAGQLLYLLSIIEDITQRRLAEDELQRKSSAVEEANIALRVLLKNREEDRGILESIVQENISKLVLPQIERMKASRLTESQMAYLDMINANLQSIVSPFLRKMSSLYVRLTPAEIQVANLIKNGKTSKEIAALLGLSKRTVDSHRENIRAKLKLAKRKMNLTTYLRSLD